MIIQWIYNLAERLEKAFKKMVKSYLPFVPLSNNTFGLSILSFNQNKVMPTMARRKITK